MSDSSENTGSYNTGSYNTGSDNTGSCNTGNDNTGNYNTGNYNTGSYNTGNDNTGSYNTGSSNTGYCNTGNHNTGNYNTGFFNTETPNKYFAFNQWHEGKLKDVNIPYIHLPLTKWINGELIQRTYKEAWEIAWAELDEDEKKAFYDLPGFDPVIFKEITGIELIFPSENVTCDNKIVEIEGIKYRLMQID